jgi:hypothetical protein
VQTGKRQWSVIHSNDITNQGGNQVFEIFAKLQEIADRLGTVEEAHMYTGEFMVITGTAANGKVFRVSLNCEEAKKNDQIVE